MFHLQEYLNKPSFSSKNSLKADFEASCLKADNELDTDFVMLEDLVSSFIQKIGTVLYDLGDWP